MAVAEWVRGALTRPIAEMLQRERGRERRSVPPYQREPLSTGRSSPTQLSRQSKSGRAEIARELQVSATVRLECDHAQCIPLS
jgi:hypothetical protein